MEDGSELQVPPVSPLLAMGTGPRLSYRWLIAIGTIATLLVGVILFTLLCSSKFFIPKETVFFATLSPKTANQLLTPDQKTTLPIAWQRSLATDSHWPVVFGMTQTGQALQAFTIGPRWSVPSSNDLSQITHALVRQVGGIKAEGPSSVKGSVPLIYRETFFDHLFERGAVQGWIDPSSIIANTSSSNQIRFFVDQHKVFLSDSIPSLASPTQLATDPSASLRPLQVDLGLHLSALGPRADIEGLLAELPLNPLHTTLNALGEVPASLELDLTSSTIQAVRLTFRNVLPLNERLALQATLDGIHTKQVITLPDGSVALETLIESKEAANSTSTENGTNFEWQNAHTSPPPTAAICGTGTWLARFSPELLKQAAPIGSSFASWVPPKAIQVWRDKQSLILCQEM